MFVPKRSGGARFLGVFAIVLLGALSVSGQDVRFFVSSKSGNRLTSKDLVQFRPQGTIKGPYWHIDEAVTYQRIDGFGASFQEAGMICVNSLEPAEQEKVLEALFDRERGAGFSVMKTVIAATDFMSAGPWYT